jgi:putative pre-16S rRNA nuclease
VAISDPDQRVAVPVGTIHAGQPPHDLKAVAALVREHAVVAVVVGHPLALSGESGEAAHHAERFAETLEENLHIPVVLEDERLTTVQAERGLAEAGRKGRERRAVVDESAATLILQSYLDRATRAPGP